MSEQTETRPGQYLNWVVIPLLLLNIALAAWLVIEIRPASQAQSTTASPRSNPWTRLRWRPKSCVRRCGS
jgi:hypothetical protein